MNKSKVSGTTCPYNNLPDRAFFKSDPSRKGNLLLEGSQEFRLSNLSTVMSAGSCFAARIASFIQKSGVKYLIADDRSTREGDAIREESEHLFSLRYGNIYTTRHLLQLLQRALGKLTAEPPAARDAEGRYRNLCRPGVLSYASMEALRADEAAHLGNVKRLLSEADVFIFTLGLTEQWLDTAAGLALPAAPGCGYGEYDPQRHRFHNSTLSEVIDELLEVFALLQGINPLIKIILTLSPVPLVATYEKMSAVEATFYSKALLRQAIASAIAKWPASNVQYFPSYEIITNPHVISENFEADKRSISEAGVARVMHHFRQRYFQTTAAEAPTQALSMSLGDAPAAIEPLAEVSPVCEEENIWTARLNKMSNT